MRDKGLDFEIMHSMETEHIDRIRRLRKKCTSKSYIAVDNAMQDINANVKSKKKIKKFATSQNLNS